MADVCHLRVEDGHLVLHSRYATSDDLPRRGVAVELQEFAGKCSVTILKDPGGTDVPRQFFFFHTTQQPPEALLIRTHLTAAGSAGGRAMSINLNRHVQTAHDGFWMVTFVQGRALRGGGAVENNTEVQLTTQRSGDPDSRVVYEAPDWKTLRQKYPAAVNEHLWPIFRDLRQLPVFAVDPAVAWQVFADDWKPDPSAAGRVTAAIPGLAAGHFADREAATAAIRAEGVDGALILARIDRAGLSAQQRTAIDGLLAGYTLLDSDEVAQRARDTEFLLDCLYCPEATVRRVAARRLSSLTGQPILFDPDDAEAARETAVEALRTKLLPTALNPDGTRGTTPSN